MYGQVIIYINYIHVYVDPDNTTHATIIELLYQFASLLCGVVPEYSTVHFSELFLVHNKIIQSSLPTTDWCLSRQL